MRFIGDVHGKWQTYADLCSEVYSSVQVGDFGIGFGDTPDFLVNGVWANGNHKFIRGNHDDPAECKQYDSFIPDMSYDSKHDIFYIGGALSIDKAYRTDGVNYWSDEELPILELQQAVDMILDIKPAIMVTHDIPEVCVRQLFSFYNNEYPSATRQALDAAFELHKPKLWIFGHWHTSVDSIIDGTRFVCLNELETLDIDIGRV
jgi:hypothetical protein